MAGHHDTGYKLLFAHPELVRDLLPVWDPRQGASLIAAGLTEQGQLFTVNERSVQLHTTVDHVERITIDPAVCTGKPCIRGLRITVKDVMEYLAAGMREAEILEEFPDLQREDFPAIYAFCVGRLAEGRTE